MVGLAIAPTDRREQRQGRPASADLALIIAEATAYAANITPAQDAFDAADEAWVKSIDPSCDAALGARKYELETVWSDHLDHFFSLAERALKLPATSRDALKRQVAAYAELLDPIVGEQDYDTPLERLPKESLLIVIDHLINRHANAVLAPDRSRVAGAGGAR